MIRFGAGATCWVLATWRTSIPGSPTVVWRVPARPYIHGPSQSAPLAWDCPRHRCSRRTLLASTLDILPEHVSEPQQRRGEEQEPGGEAIVETEPDVVNLNRVIFAKLEEA